MKFSVRRDRIHMQRMWKSGISCLRRSSALQAPSSIGHPKKRMQIWETSKISRTKCVQQTYKLAENPIVIMQGIKADDRSHSITHTLS